MSRGLNDFVKNFFVGLNAGSQIADRYEQGKYRKAALDAQMRRLAQAAAIHKEKMDDTRERTRLYGVGIEARAAKDRAKAGGGGGGGGAAAGNPALSSWMGKWAQGVSPELPQTNATTYVVPEQEPPAVSAPPGGGGGGEDDGAETFARGGFVEGLASGFASGASRANRTAFAPKAPAPKTGTTGPGSGMGQPAAPPPDVGTGTGETYRRGGPVQKFEGGGTVYPEGWPPPPEDPLWSPQGDMVRQNTIDEIRQRRVNRATGSLGAPNEPPPVTSRELVGNRPEPGDDREAAYRWSEQTPGRTGGARTDRQVFSTEPVPIIDRGNVGETGEFPEMTRDRPPNDSPDQFYQDDVRSAPPASGPPQGVGGAGGGNRGGGRGETGWKPLRDQTRAAAFDPADKDLYDPDNAHKVDGSGRAISTAPPVGGSPATGPRTATSPEGGTGMGGAAPGMSTNSAKNDYTDAMAGAASYAARVSQTGDPQQAKAELFSGKGAADPKMMQQVFQTVDPDNTLSMDQKIQRSVKVVHDYHMAKGDKATADESAFQIAQFSNNMARNHGVEAVKALQGGDVKTAVNQLVAGYNWLPDGYTADVQGDKITISDEQGKVAHSYPLDPKALQNIALGMASGQLGWDVIRTRGTMGQLPSMQAMDSPPPAGGPPATAPPTALNPTAPTRPAAQPQAAPAGPQAPPPAAPPTRAAPPAPPAGPAAPAGPKPPVAPAPAGGPTASASGTAAGPVAKTAINTGDGALPPTGQGDATKTEPPAGTSQPRTPVRQIAQDPKEQKQIEQEIAQTTKLFVQQRDEMLREAQQAGIYRTKDGKAYVDGVIRAKTKQFEDWKRGQEAKLGQARSNQSKQDFQEQFTTLAPQKLSINDKGQLATEFKSARDAMVKEWSTPAGSDHPDDKQTGARRQYAAQSSPLRYMKTDGARGPLDQLALTIQRHNNGLTSATAYELANEIASIVPPAPGHTGGGKGVTRYKEQGNLARGHLLTLPDGRRINIDNNGYQTLQGILAQNWAQYEKEDGARKKEAENASKGKKAFNELGSEMSRGIVQGIRQFLPTELPK